MLNYANIKYLKNVLIFVSGQLSDMLFNLNLNYWEKNSEIAPLAGVTKRLFCVCMLYYYFFFILTFFLFLNIFEDCHTLHHSFWLTTYACV